jgi:U3 small nucleolar RNA-associated protein 19
MPAKRKNTATPSKVTKTAPVVVEADGVKGAVKATEKAGKGKATKRRKVEKAEVVSKVETTEVEEESDEVPEDQEPAAGKTKDVKGGSKETTLEEVREHEERIKEGRAHHNHIVTLLDLVEASLHRPESAAVVIGASQSLRRVMKQLVDSGDLVVVVDKVKKDASNEAKEVAGPGALDQYRKWLRGLYKRFVRLLFGMLLRDNIGLQAAALHSLMDCVRIEAKQSTLDDGSFQGQLLPTVVLVSLMNPVLAQAVVDDLVTKFLKPHADLRYYVIKSLQNVAETPLAKLEKSVVRTLSDPERPVGDTSTVLPAFSAAAFARNTVDVLLRLKMPEAEKKPVFFALPPGKPGDSKKRKKKFELAKQQTMLSDAWLAALRISLPAEVYRDVLVHLHKHVLPHLTNPLLLSDFLTDAYNIGGVVSLLALDGLFFLITKHNLDYPNFYHKLYSLLKPEAMHAKYAARFFKLLALCLTSSHLPSYMVASFSKRMARLCLRAPPGPAVFLTTAVFNLIRRHPSCRYLVHKPPKEAMVAGRVGQLSLLKAVQAAQDQDKRATDALKLNDTETTTVVTAAVMVAETNDDAKVDAEATEVEVVDEKEIEKKGQVEVKEKEATEVGGEEEAEEEGDEDEDGEGDDEGDDEDELETEIESHLAPGVDPFDVEQDDPSLTHADKSSLWEMKTLTNHYCPQVSRMAKELFALNAQKTKDLDVGEAAVHGYESLFTDNLNWRKKQPMPLTYEQPTSFFAREVEGLGVFAL